MIICYRGNFRPQHSTESHVAWSLEDLGHEVRRAQEDEVGWYDTARMSEGADLFMWTQTYGYAQNWDRQDAYACLFDIRERMPCIGFHLDIWWGLEREWMVHSEEPFFRSLHVIYTADGDHDEGWMLEGIGHRWSPPAVFGRECVPGSYRPDLASDVTFVGSWRGYAHEAWWPQRRDMLAAARQHYGGRARYWPAPGGPAVRGQLLNDTLASCKITLGDSCLADRSRRYFSDRAFETVGRGGFLVSPYVESLAGMLEDGVHCRYYLPGDHAEMLRLCDYYLAHDEERERIRATGQAHVAAHHTYGHRLQAVLTDVARWRPERSLVAMPSEGLDDIGRYGEGGTAPTRL